MGKVIDLTGQKFGRLTVISRAEKPEGSHSTSAFWLCRCECGNEKVVSANVLRQGKSQSCGCYNIDSHANKYIDLTGKQFGYWTVISKAEKPKNLKSPGAYWLCKCVCGKEKIITGHSLLQGKSKSCGSCRIDIVDDLTGQVFDQLTVLNRDFSRPSNNDGAFWRCRCSCGNEITVLGKNLKHQTRHSCGCIASFGEMTIKKILQENNINFQSQYTFDDLHGLKGGLLRFDFAILNENNKIIRLIEYQGQQHYNFKEYNTSWFDAPLEHDKLKRQYCKKNNYVLVYIPYWKRDNISLEDILGDKYVVDLTNTEVA